MKTEVNGGVLKVFFDRSVSTANKIKLTLAAGMIDSLRVAGCVNGAVSGVSNQLLTVDLSGVGNLKIDGATDALKFTMSGAGEMEAEKLAVRRAVVDLSGTGHAAITATEALNASISGVGQVDYYGNPGKVTESISGLGRLKKH